MNIIVCLDNSKGMLFNNRRQSRDKSVVEDIIGNLAGKKLLIAPFSKKLFADFSDNVKVDACFLKNAEKDDFCFVEDVDLGLYCEKINGVTVYNWNRDYPADFFCNIDFSGYKLVEETEFSGNSHEKITKQIFVRGD